MNETSTPLTRPKTDEITGLSGGAALAGSCESNPDASAIASTDRSLLILTLGHLYILQSGIEPQALALAALFI